MLRTVLLMAFAAIAMAMTGANTSLSASSNITNTISMDKRDTPFGFPHPVDPQFPVPKGFVFKGGGAMTGPLSCKSWRKPWEMKAAPRVKQSLDKQVKKMEHWHGKCIKKRKHCKRFDQEKKKMNAVKRKYEE